ncbi:UNVERIFIED_ORG: glutathionylspermidine synthase [Methylobacterium sp. SuP10 SLI 274]|nr:glutathionylspermidine synthase [Methylorubrum extorquens]MDF9862823.1 glutathionylspermidine synthase [Methylorubrum pseudosasae]MDH6636434.1 glutathionylspermidine synthase [Methylobacterium sp. SuP10 SLI 274]MDH6665613.1 glutathionylspermidine synthase [Methylorubrum zatmanii]
MADERILTSLAIPEPVWDTVRASWHRRDPSLYGRLDFSYGGMGPAKLLEYNADTPTALYETAVFQWLWLEQGLKEGRLPAGSDQFNALHERLIARLAEIAPPGLIAFAADTSGPEDLGTAGYLQDCAVQAGCATILLDLAQVGLRADGAFCGPDEQPFAALFKLYPWEWAFQDAFGSAVAASPTRFLEPPWKMVLSNKGLLAHLWACEPGHPNLLPAFFEADPANATLGNAYVRKPLLSREGANVEIFSDGARVAGADGPYGADGFIRQGVAELPCFDGRRPLLGAWIVGDAPAGLCIRESDGPITGDGALFVPHLIEPS